VKTVLIQAGHNASREPKGNLPNQTGTPGEIELVRAIQRSLIARLKRDGRFNPIPVPGDIPDGIHVDAALFLHADGVNNSQARGFCFGYPSHPVNERLAELIRAEFLRLPGHPPSRRDNTTGDLRGYYGYRLVNSRGPEVLVEHGFLTNPSERRWLRENVDELAAAEHRALCRFFGLKLRGGSDNGGGHNGGRRTYAVRRSDTLSRIAARLHIAGGWQALYAANADVIGPDPNRLVPGTVLRLP
jgi:nucleoid-associated protein YgaU